MDELRPDNERSCGLMPYRDPGRARQAKRESARRRRTARGSTISVDPDLLSRVTALKERLQAVERLAVIGAAFIEVVAARVDRRPPNRMLAEHLQDVLLSASRAAERRGWEEDCHAVS